MVFVDTICIFRTTAPARELASLNIIILPFVLCKIKSSSLTDELCIELEQPFRFIRVIFRVTDPAFSCDFMQFHYHTRIFDCICIDSRKACI